jgi:cytochrome c oxidase subunit 1
MLYALGFILLFTIGGLTGLFLGALAVDVPLHDTYFVIAHFHYVMVCSMVFAFLGGMYHWFPKMFGKMVNQNWGRAAAIMLFIGFNVTFFPQFVMGTHGSPRRWATYPAEFQPYHVMSTIGAYIMAISLITVALNWLTALLWGKKAPANPWGGNSLEWHTPSPPPHDNFPTPPVADDPYNLNNWVYDPSIEGWVPRTSQPAAAEGAPADRTRPVTH